MPETITSAPSAASAISTWPRKPSPKFAHRIGGGLSHGERLAEGILFPPLPASLSKVTLHA